VIESSFSRIKLKRRKKNVVYVNGGHVIAAMNIYKSSLTMEETLPDKGILEKLTRERKSLAFYTTVNKLKP
jgi:hypothetical protein